MLLYRTSRNRRGGVAFLAVLLVLPMFFLVAFSIDLNYTWRTDSQLQNAADAAALAGVCQLLDPAQRAAQTGLDADTRAQLLQTTYLEVLNTARSCVELHQAGGVPLVLREDDVRIGYLADPTAKPDAPGGEFQTGENDPFPNSVEVTVRRDPTVSTGPLTLFFGAIFGTPSFNRQASATATWRTQGIIGFNGAGCRLLPLAVDVATSNWLLGKASAPAGCSAQDSYTVKAPSASNLVPPANVSPTSDHIREGKFTLMDVHPGNCGLVSLTNNVTGSIAAYQNWIINGPSSSELISFSPQGLQATSTTPLTMYAGPPLSSDLEASFRSIIGQPRILLIYQSFDTATYQVVGMVGATVVDVDLNGTPSASLTLQLSPTLDPSVVRRSGTSSAQFVASGISLSR